MWDYTDTVKEHFLHPRNARAMADADAVGEVGSLACGDALKLFLKIDAKGVITDATFQTFGCASAIASSSVLTEMLRGKTVEEARKITNKDIAQALGGLPREKMHCSVMGQEALAAALENHAGVAARAHEPEGELVCKCFGVTDVQIRRAIRENGLTTLEEVTDFTKAGGGCGDCHERIGLILAEELSSAAAAPHTPGGGAKKPLTNLERMRRVTRVMEEEIRPALKKDGGDIELVDIEGQEVIVSLRGACVGCPSSALTLAEFVQRRLRETVEPDIRVREARP
ncbi:Fe-S cluster assembly protein NifU [Desulfolutivibrio sulfoxidireducens]|uniref:Fe-S cluster assembly protein NifU n=1 Tax=Desulfolutivibrio sulfoxidireducens TaxID=2773299 RepID=UPI00159D7B2C|nr:Fe-S cluster assembly protein NifU [Desulfolutivibrio sulfoxidireducens]QLA16697.1 Fe-S cluster assembly protein NifU [Desulfolutivibrio sulfoxidireducens]QLA19426.1 Fe-S cluster assembly protein NifU [Desulfolutivibrio sulfoxidireducens]